MGRQTRKAASGCVTAAFAGSAVSAGCGDARYMGPPPNAGHYVQATGPPIWCPSAGLLSGQRWVTGKQPNVREDIVTTKTAHSFNVRTLVGLSIVQAKPIAAQHSCALRRGISWLTSVEPNRVDIRVRNGRIVWARVF